MATRSLAEAKRQVTHGRFMATAATLDERAGKSTADFIATKALKSAAVLWVLVAVAGQVAFAVYIFAFYGSTAALGNWEAWNKRLIHGIVEGDPIGNIAVMVHLALAFVITVGGPLQLVPQIRARAPTFHHWNGRVYILTAFVISLGALYMVWTRGVLGGFANHLAISLNAVLIMICAGYTVRHAIARNIDIHRRWALRLFLVVSGVWFFRVGLMAWVILNQGPVGVGENLDGPFAVFLAFGQYLVPLAVLEVYLRTQDRAGALGKSAMAVFLLGLTALTGLGIFGAYNFMWLPRLMSLTAS
jgi:hypothetical protein